MLQFKEYAFARVLRESYELGLAEVWEHSTGPAPAPPLEMGAEQGPAGALSLGSPSPRTQHHPFQAAPQLLTKTKDALYGQAASAKKNKLQRCFFFSRHSQANQPKY